VTDPIETELENEKNRPKRSKFALRPGSVRMQVIAWNVLALSVLLGVLGIVVRYSVKELMLHSIDVELLNRSRQPRRNGPPPPRNGPPPVQADGSAPSGRSSSAQAHEPGGTAPADNPPDGQGDPSGPPQQNQDNQRPNDDPTEAEQGPGQAQRQRQGPGPDQDPDPSRHNGRAGRGGMPEGQGPPPGDENGYRPVLLSMQGESLDPRAGRSGPWDLTAFNEMRTRSASMTLTHAGLTSIDNVTIDGLPFRLLTQARQDPLHHRVIVQIPYPLTDVIRAMDQMDRALLTLIPLALLCAAIGGWYLTGRVLQRVSHLTSYADSIGARDLTLRLPVSGDDEFSDLAATFNRMLGRLEQVFKRQEQLLDQQRRFTADASHELKTPLTIIRGNTSLALSGHPTEEDYKQSIQEIDTAAGTMAQLVQDLLTLARSDRGVELRDRVELPISEIIQQAIAEVRPLSTVSLELKISDEGLCVIGVQDELVRLFKNLLDNAMRYTPTDGKITVSAQQQGNSAVITITDTGKGIAPQHLAHLGERFYRVESSRARPHGGTGLGLSICKGIAESHGGSLQFASMVGKGTAVTVTLPAEVS